MNWRTAPGNGITVRLPSGTPVRLGIVWDADTMRDVAYIVPGCGDHSGRLHAAMIAAVPELLAVAQAVVAGRDDATELAQEALAKAASDSGKNLLQGWGSGCIS
jgi:hypothetical protein